MKYIIISDIHGNLEAFDAAVASFPRGKDKVIVSAGDVVGYGANPGECIDKVISLGCKNVLGNHDAAVIDKTDITYFNETAAEAVLWTKEHLSQEGKRYLEGLPLVLEEKLFTVVHGTLHYPEEFIYMMTGPDALHTFGILKNKICFVGHSHIPGVFVFKEGRLYESFKKKLTLDKDAQYIINVGSVGQPRDGDNRVSYCVYDPRKKEIEFKRIEYDINKARKRIIKAGLPQVLGDRLLMGR